MLLTCKLIGAERVPAIVSGAAAAGGVNGAESVELQVSCKQPNSDELSQVSVTVPKDLVWAVDDDLSPEKMANNAQLAVGQILARRFQTATIVGTVPLVQLLDTLVPTEGLIFPGNLQSAQASFTPAADLCAALKVDVSWEVCRTCPVARSATAPRKLFPVVGSGAVYMVLISLLKASSTARASNARACARTCALSGDTD